MRSLQYGCSTEAWDPVWQDVYCDWRKRYFNDGIEPPSWVIGDQVLAAGTKGIVFKSAISGGTNLVLYNDGLTDSDSIEVYDPTTLYPRIRLPGNRVALPVAKRSFLTIAVVEDTSESARYRSPSSAYRRLITEMTISAFNLLLPIASGQQQITTRAAILASAHEYLVM